LLEVFKNAIDSDSAEARKLAGCLVQALFGASFGYKPCCIFNFVKDTYEGVIPIKALSKADERHMCPECQEIEECA
jgi:hypothetical protein